MVNASKDFIENFKGSPFFGVIKTHMHSNVFQMLLSSDK